jgi:hypothetical protein
MRRMVVVWLVTGLVLALTAELAWEHLWIAAYWPTIAWVIWGIALLGLELLRLRRPQRRRAVAVELAAMVVVAVAFLPTARMGAWLTATIRFRLQRPRYERLIAELSSVPSDRREHRWHGIRYIAEQGPPLRVAFPWPGGILDNWCGVVYDPTKLVLQANNFTGDWEKWRQQVPGEVIVLFGGDMLHCNEIDPPFYYCCFT